MAPSHTSHAGCSKPTVCDGVVDDPARDRLSPVAARLSGYCYLAMAGRERRLSRRRCLPADFRRPATWSSGEQSQPSSVVGRRPASCRSSSRASTSRRVLYDDAASTIYRLTISGGPASTLASVRVMYDLCGHRGARDDDESADAALYPVRLIHTTRRQQHTSPTPGEKSVPMSPSQL